MIRFPKVTVITVVLNGRRFIRTAMESVLGQTYPNIEYIVKDGGSTDGTQSIVKEYGEYAALLNEPDRGRYHGMNQALRFATGDIIAFLDADSFYASPDAIMHMVRTMEETEAEAGWGNIAYVLRKKPQTVVRRPKSAPFSRDKFSRGWQPPHAAFFARRAVYEEHGGFRPGLGNAAGYELMLRFLYRFRVSSCYLPETIVMLRTGRASGSSESLLKNRTYTARAWKMNGFRRGFAVSWLKLFRNLPDLFR
jgi:glycosyltransferase involved in cell wall biosynthesis